MIDLDVPRDVNGEFEPGIVKKHERALSSELEKMRTPQGIEFKSKTLFAIAVKPL